MAKGVERAWPPDDDIVALAAECATQVEVAHRLGVHTQTLYSRFRLNPDLRDRVLKALARPATTVGPAPERGEEVSREEILEAENRELRAALSKDRKGDVHAERITRAVEKAVAAFRPAVTPRAKRRQAATDRAHHRGLLCLSDFHGGEVVDPGVINQLNAYSWQIMLDRISELKAAVVSHVRNGPPLTGLDVLFIGDMNSGANHDEITITNEYPLAEQAVRMGALEGEIVEDLATELALPARAGGIEGNHPRFTKAPAAKMPHNNGDWISNVIAAQYLEPRGIPFEIGRGSMLWKIAGRTMYVWHGDGIRSSMPGVPWGGVMRRTNQIQATMPTRIDHFLHGHFHQANVVQGGRLIGNGALKGTDEWVTKNFGGGDPPTQIMLTFDERSEWLTGVSYITPRAGVPA
jgi:transposase-like protein